VDTDTARKRLEEMRGELDKSITVLQGEQPAERIGSDSPQDPADAGTNLSENDRTQAVLEAAKGQLRAVLDALDRIERDTYGTCADCANGKLCLVGSDCLSKSCMGNVCAAPTRSTRSRSRLAAL